MGSYSGAHVFTAASQQGAIKALLLGALMEAIFINIKGLDTSLTINTDI